MAALVVDPSIALAWGLPDESSAYAEAALAVVEKSVVHVPELWPREVANGLAIAYLRKRITPADEEKSLAELSRLTIHTCTFRYYAHRRVSAASHGVLLSPVTVIEAPP